MATIISEATKRHLDDLTQESIFLIREAVATAENPALLYSIGKDSSVLLDLVLRAFRPSKPPLRLLHVDTGWKFSEMIKFRDQTARDLGLELIVHQNPRGPVENINPFDHGSRLYTQIMKTDALKQALEKHKFDVMLLGTRRDEEKSRAKERIFSLRNKFHVWDPKNQRPEFAWLYNTTLLQNHSLRVSPLSNWTEYDVWSYIALHNVPVVPLYFSAPRPIVRRDDALIMVDDQRMPLDEGEKAEIKVVRFRTLGCYPLTGAVESVARNFDDILAELRDSTTSERQGRLIDHDQVGSMEKKKKEGYF